MEYTLNRNIYVVNIFIIILSVVLSFFFINQNYLGIFFSLVAVFVIISLTYYDISIAIFLFMIPYSWALPLVGFFDLVDQKLSYLLCYIIFLVALFHKRRLLVRNIPIFYPYLLVLSVSAASIVLSPNKLWSLKELIKMGYHFMVLVIVCDYVSQKGNLRLIKTTFFLATLSVAILGLLQYFFNITLFQPMKIDLTWDKTEITYNTIDLNFLSEGGVWLKRIGAVYLSSPNQEANFLIIGFFLCLTELIYSGFVSWYFLGFLAISSSIILSESRGAWLGIAAGLSLLVVFLSRTKKKSKIFVVCVAIGLILLPLSFLISERLEGFQNESSTLSHLTAWEAGWGAIQESPIIGKGLGAFQLGEVYSSYIQSYGDHPEFVSGAENYKHLLLHNYFLQAWAETGLLGLGAWLWMIAVFFKKTWGFLRNGNPSQYAHRLCLAFFLSAIAMLVQNFTINFFAIELWTVLAVALGIVIRPSCGQGNLA
jgi:O-antigen ligase